MRLRRGGALHDEEAERLSQLDVRVSPGPAAQLDDAADFRNFAQQLLVPCPQLGPGLEKNGVARALGPQPPPQEVGEERYHGCNQLDRADKRVPERPERAVVAVPEASAGAADVPVREVVDEGIEGTDERRCPVALVRVGQLRCEL